MILENNNFFSVGKPHNGLDSAPGQLTCSDGSRIYSHTIHGKTGPSNVLMVPSTGSETLTVFISNGYGFLGTT